MAKQKRRTISTADAGSEDPEPVDVVIASPGEYPEQYENASDSWKAAFDHAAKHDNTPKACVLFADAHAEHFEEGSPPDADDLLARIAELEAKLAEK